MLEFEIAFVFNPAQAETDWLITALFEQPFTAVPVTE